jgi:predicted deacylase
MTTPLEQATFGSHSPGKNLLITAGVHGDEYVPMLAVRELIRLFKTTPSLHQQLSGRITLIPIANPSAFHQKQRCGQDQLDLARTCPGNPHGSITEQLAATLSEIIQQADYYIDLHTGGTEYCVHPLAGYLLHPDPAILKTQRQMASAFGLPLIWGTWAGHQGRTLSVARDVPIPAIYVEYLGGHAEANSGHWQSWAQRPDHLPFEKHQTQHPLVSGCLNVLRQLGILSGTPTAHQPKIIEDHRPHSGHMQICHPAPISGFFQRRAQPGQTITKNQILGIISSPLGDQKTPVLAANSGTLVTLRWHPAVNQGESIAVIAQSSPA